MNSAGTNWLVAKNNFYLFITLAIPALMFGPDSRAEKGHCNISADKKWIEKNNAIFAQSEDPNTKVNGVDKKGFNDLVKKEHDFLEKQKRTIPQDMSRCGNTHNIDNSPDREELKKLQAFDSSLSSKKNLTCLCDNDTKKNRDGAKDPMSAKVDPPPKFADPTTQKPAPHIASQEPDPATHQTEPAQKTSPVLTDDQKVTSTLANPGTMSQEHQQMLETGKTYSYFAADYGPQDERPVPWQPGPSFTDDKGRIYETWTRDGITWARLKPNR